MLIELRDRTLRWILLLALLGFLSLLWAQPINLTAVDIGRHIKNGELICQGQLDLFYKNYYSFTFPEYPFINHHWFFGVVTFLLWKQVGFIGLSIAYVAMLLLAFLLFYKVARRYASFSVVLLISVLTFSVISDRKEIRPEGFSTLAMAIYFYLLSRFKWGSISTRALVLIVLPLQLIWVNTHIFFFMGPLLVALFIWDASVTQRLQAQQRSLQKLLLGVTFINIINPSGIWGMLTPLNVFKEFGYRLAENQQIVFMMKRFPSNTSYWWYLGLVVIAVVGILLVIKREGIKKHLPFLCLTLFVAAAGIKAVRLMPFFGFVFIPLAAMCYGRYFNNRSIKIIVVAVAILLAWVQFKTIDKNVGVGLMPGINKSAEFFKEAGLKGPIFSNYDIGGYLIFHLSPREKLFVDNRQEAFPPDFFKEVYVPMQESSSVWQEQLAKYDFQVVYFYRHDLTPWGQQLMIDRVNDPAWAPVFVDNYVIIFTRQVGVNQGVIEKYELPKSMFTVAK